jgi:hypothetical protein
LEHHNLAEFVELQSLEAEFGAEFVELESPGAEFG